MRLVCDAEAVAALLDPKHPAERAVRRALEAARLTRRSVAVATVTLAELYRGVGRSQMLDSWLAREAQHALVLRDTDRQFARLVGALLREADLGSAHLADAHVVAAAVEDGGGMILTGDPADLRRLAAPYHKVHVEALDARAGSRRSRR